VHSSSSFVDDVSIKVSKSIVRESQPQLEVPTSHGSYRHRENGSLCLVNRSSRCADADTRLTRKKTSKKQQTSNLAR
jgi:hypothetical protein